MILYVAPDSKESGRKIATVHRVPPRKQDNDAERAERIDRILEELRLNTEDLRELSDRVRQHALADLQNTRLFIEQERRRVPRG